jgi:hypothetical protein
MGALAFMPLTGAEKQARHRAKRDAELAQLQREVIALRAENAKLRDRLDGRRVEEASAKKPTRFCSSEWSRGDG